MGIIVLENPAITLLGIYPEDSPACNKDTCSTMFIAALFIIARSWKEPRCPSMEEWIQKMWYIYTMEYYSAIKNNEFMSFFRQMDGTGKYHPKQGNSITKEYTWNAISDKWILISPEALNTQGTNHITNDSHEEVWRGS